MSEAIDYSDLPAFFKELVCPKCGSNKFTTRWIAERIIEESLVDTPNSEWALPIEDKVIPEHLARTCECGWKKLEAVLGQSTTEKAKT
jgi:RNA polymerase subunit RPABC4/transcription elongation factor Spt4